MAETTGISWAHSTANPWTGCRRVSPGCQHCYMFTWKERHGKKGTDRERTKSMWKDAIKWNRAEQRKLENISQPLKPGFVANPNYKYERPRVFPSLCDWLDDEVPIEWLADFLKLIHDTPNLDWLLLTKRPENFSSRLAEAIGEWGERKENFDNPKEGPFTSWLTGWRTPAYPAMIPRNVWIGVSVENQKYADIRIPQLRDIPAAVRFLSVEPLLEMTDIIRQTNPNCFDWVIVGGESGPDRRDCGMQAIRNVAEQCVSSGIPIFVKQDCAFKPGQRGRLPDEIWALKQFPRL